MPSQPPSTSREVGGRYALGRPLGSGAQGTTFEAVDKQAGLSVAIKEFRIRGAESWKDVELAEREARVLRTLDHPQLPRFIDHFEEGGCLYLVMERIDGESLRNLQARGAPLAEADVLRFLEDAAEILDYLHSRAPPVVHRDIKPGNVLRRPDGSFAIVDFGAVRDRLKAEGGSTVVGTFGYMAPEQFQGRALPATDVYAVAATAMTMLTGMPPEDLPHRGLTIDVPRALGGRVDGRLLTALQRMLDPDPDRRAERILPLIRGLDATPHPDSDGPSRYRPSAERPAFDAFAWRPHRRGPRGGMPPLPSALLQLGLVVAEAAVALSMLVVVPMVLTLLALVTTPKLRGAAQAVRSAGRATIGSLRRGRRAVAGGSAAPGGRRRRGRHRRPRHRVDDRPKTRVASDPDGGDSDAPDARERPRASRRS